MDLVEGKLGTVGDYELAVSSGKLVVTINVKHGVIASGLSLELDALAVLDVLAAAIPGTIDDAIINVAKAALGSQA